MKLEIKLPTGKKKSHKAHKYLIKFRAQICMSMFKKCWELNRLGMKKDEKGREMDNREGKGSNMMVTWRVTSEKRLQEKTQLQPVLEAGKMTDKGVALSDSRCYRSTSYGWERHTFRPMEQLWLLQQRAFQKTWTAEEWHQPLESGVSQLKGEICDTSSEFLYLNKQIKTQLKP